MGREREKVEAGRVCEEAVRGQAQWPMYTGHRNKPPRRHPRALATCIVLPAQSSPPLIFKPSRRG